MRRTFAFVWFVALGAVSAVAQTPTPTPTHPPHQPASQHHPVQGQMDPALHAAMHARLVGNWAGTIRPGDGDARKMLLAVAADHQGKLSVTLNTERSLQAGAASDVVMDAHGLRWNQSVAGASCKAVAILAAPDHHNPDSMKGTMTCGDREIAFTVQKTQPK